MVSFLFSQYSQKGTELDQGIYSFDIYLKPNLNNEKYSQLHLGKFEGFSV